jgi:hypothetical protein
MVFNATFNNMQVSISVLYLMVWGERKVVCFVDIGRIDEHHCLNFLFTVFNVFFYFRQNSRIFVPVWMINSTQTFIGATFNNISVISWQSVLLVEETGVPRPVPSHYKTLSHNVVLSTPHYEWGTNPQPLLYAWISFVNFFSRKFDKRLF